MRYLENIQLEQLIVHVLDPWGLTKPILSGGRISLAENPKLKRYFELNIEDSLRDPLTTAAKFKESESGTTAAVCNDILLGKIDLVEGSRQLAKRLYEIMARNAAISAGDLVVCLFEAKNESRIQQYLALLKLDLEDLYTVFRHVTRGGVVVFQFPELPLVRRRLQKCAFVQPRAPRLDYDMLVLDRQVRRRERRAVARFFAKDFLNCAMVLDARQRTHLFYAGALDACNELWKLLSPDENTALRQSIDEAVTAQVVDIDEWLDGLSLAKGHRDKINKIVSERLPDRVFDTDEKYAQDLVKRRRFRGDFGLQFDVQADMFDLVVKKLDWCRVHGGPDHYEIWLETIKLQEVPG